MNFRLWLESQLQLPSIPPDMIRLTHFTSENIAKRFLQGQPFLYKALDSTTDSFSNNNDITNLVQSGNTGPFNRSHFGDHVLLIDMPYDHHRKHRANAPQNFVPNTQIVGVIDRNNMVFIPNRRYNPNAAKVPRVRNIDEPRPAVISRPVDQPTPSLSKEIEIW
jgi:hypothetical protein